MKTEKSHIRPVTLYAAVRKATDDGHEWVDTTRISSLFTQVEDWVKEDNKRLPQWAAANPIQRIVSVTVSEWVTVKEPV